jgi:hypothetical protein
MYKGNQDWRKQIALQKMGCELISADNVAKIIIRISHPIFIRGQRCFINQTLNEDCPGGAGGRGGYAAFGKDRS